MLTTNHNNNPFIQCTFFFYILIDLLRLLIAFD